MVNLGCQTDVLSEVFEVFRAFLNDVVLKIFQHGYVGWFGLMSFANKNM